MGLLKKIFNAVKKEAKKVSASIKIFFIKLFVTILYVYQIFIFATDGSSNSFVYLFYVIVFSLPQIICRIISNNRTVIIICGLALITYGGLFFIYYTGIASLQIYIWLAITSYLLFRKEKLLVEILEQESNILLPVVSLIICITILIYSHYGENYFFTTTDLKCSSVINTSNIPGLSQESQEIINEKEFAIVDTKACVSQDNKYSVIVRPVKNKFFSKDRICINSDVETYNELLSEIKYVSKFYNSYLVSYSTGLSAGIYNFVASLFKSLFRIVSHPINTILSIINAIKLIPDWFSKVKTNPSIIVTGPIQEEQLYLDEIVKKIAQNNNIHLDKIILIETVNALKHERNILYGGEKSTAIISTLTPLIGGVGKTAKVIKEMSTTKVTSAVKVSTKEVTELTKAGENVTKAIQNTYEKTKIAGIDNPIKDIEKKIFLSRKEEPANNLNSGKIHKETVTDKIKGGGPEDQSFDKYKNVASGKNGIKRYDEASFQKGYGGIPGRKPTPDGLWVDAVKREKTYWEDKRPSEWQSHNWKSTYNKDPIDKERTSAVKDMKDGKISDADADARIVIAENDDHFIKRGQRWNDPADVPTKGYHEKLGFRLPDVPADRERINAFIRELQNAGRHPEVWKENNIIYIRYDIIK